MTDNIVKADKSITAISDHKELNKFLSIPGSHDKDISSPSVKYLPTFSFLISLLQHIRKQICIFM